MVCEGTLLADLIVRLKSQLAPVSGESAKQKSAP